MSLRNNIRPKLSALISFLAVSLFFTIPSAASADLGKDYVIVIDVSTSMQDIFDEVKQLTKQTLGEAKAGDNVAIITFGERATLLDRKLIRGEADIEELQRQVGELYPTDYVTYINSGLEKSLAELRYLFEKSPERERVLLWLSDDKDNPPAQLGEDFVSLDKLREKTEKFEPGREWFAYQAPLVEVKNKSLEDFVTWARRTTFRVGVKETGVNLGSSENENVQKTVVLTFEPQHPGVAGLEFFAAASLVDPTNPERRIPVTLTPNRVVAASHVWQQQFNVSFEGAPGDYQGEIVFQSVSGPLLDVVPRTISMTAMIVPPKPLEQEQPKVVEEPKPRGLLADAKEKGIIATESRPPGTTRPERPFTFGPLEPGKKAVQFFDLYLNKEADSSKIAQNVAIKLPEGVNVESRIFGKRGTKLTAEVTVSVGKEVVLPEEIVLEGAYEGNIRFVSNETGVEILPLAFPIRVEMNTDRVRWGKKILPATRSLDAARARGMSFEEITRELEAEGQQKSNPVISALRLIYKRLSSRYVLIPILVGIVILALLLLYRMRPANELFAGELVVIKDPTDSKMKNIHLKRIGSLHGKDVLTIGSSPSADIRLDHASVAPIHCRLLARNTEEQIEVSIAPVKGSLLKVNDVECAAKNRLSDKDLLGIGEFILLFSSPESTKEVVVHFRDGQTMRGTPVTWDIGASSFELLRTDIEGVGETAEEISIVPFQKLKAVFFLQGSSGAASSLPKERIRQNELLEITFFDGEKIEGNPLVDYSNLSARFYLVPTDMPNIFSILIERTSVKEISKREAQSEPQASAGKTGFFKGRRKEASTD